MTIAFTCALLCILDFTTLMCWSGRVAACYTVDVADVISQLVTQMYYGETADRVSQPIKILREIATQGVY